MLDIFAACGIRELQLLPWHFGSNDLKRLQSSRALL
jgi:hypothetical protein